MNIPFSFIAVLHFTVTEGSSTTSITHTHSLHRLIKVNHRLFLISEHKQKATDLDHDRTEESLKFLQRLSKANKTDGQTTKAVS
jgi:hypothetical protein